MSAKAAEVFPITLRSLAASGGVFPDTTACIADVNAQTALPASTKAQLKRLGHELAATIAHLRLSVHEDSWALGYTASIIGNTMLAVQESYECFGAERAALIVVDRTLDLATPLREARLSRYASMASSEVAEALSAEVCDDTIEVRDAVAAATFACSVHGDAMFSNAEAELRLRSALLTALERREGFRKTLTGLLRGAPRDDLSLVEALVGQLREIASLRCYLGEEGRDASLSKAVTATSGILGHLMQYVYANEGPLRALQRLTTSPLGSVAAAASSMLKSFGFGSSTLAKEPSPRDASIGGTLVLFVVGGISASDVRDVGMLSGNCASNMLVLLSE